MSDYLKVQIAKHCLRTGSFVKPTILGIALHIGNPTSVPIATEVVGGSYARVSSVPADANWLTANLATLQFPTPSAPWGTVTHCSIWDALVGGNMLLYGVLAVPRTIVTSTDTHFLTGALVVTFT